MTPDVVVDIGNSRMKWGRVFEGKIVEAVALPLDNAVEWERALEQWPASQTWLISGVVPRTITRFEEWLAFRSLSRTILTNDLLLKAQDQFRTAIDEPDAIGIDRLLGSYSASLKTDHTHSAVAISVGTAMTVDFVQTDGTHVGGAILPGPRLMSKSLHDYTAQLPLIEIDDVPPVTLWGENTEDAIEIGIYNAILGAADALVWEWSRKASPLRVYITGGDCRMFRRYEFTAEVASITIENNLILDGLCLIAEHLS